MTESASRLKAKSLKVEFGDFQTPSELAQKCCELLREKGIEAAALIEPTCGSGAFLVSAIDAFPAARWGIGLEINPIYAASARAKIVDGKNFKVLCRSFFDFDWSRLLGALPDPLLVVGNPPWVTNSTLGELKSTNVPLKKNFDELRGLDALTGKSNFDISEWILISICDWLNGRDGTLAMLCKAAVARKIFQRASKTQQGIRSFSLYSVDAMRNFGAAVDACFLIVEFEPGKSCRRASLYESLTATAPLRVLSYEDDRLVGDAGAYERVKHLSGKCAYQWRSGVKHDCAAVMEIYAEDGGYRNGLGEHFDLEETFLYPILKSSEVASGACEPSRKVIVTQQAVGESTEKIRVQAPRTWEYLASHSLLLDGRQSRIYKDKPKYSMFGIGDYSFSPWKVAISGLYKKLAFSLVAPSRGKPVMLDDTVYFLSFQSKIEAESVLNLLNSDLAKDFFNAQIFWDAKRPITADILGRLDINRLASELGISLERPVDTEPETPDSTLLPLFA